MITIDLTTENLLKINELTRLFCLYCIKHNIPSERAGYPNKPLRDEWNGKRLKFIEDNWNIAVFDTDKQQIIESTVDYSGIVIESKYAYEEV